MHSLIFLSNSLVGDLRHLSRIPLEFITFAQMEGKMYYHMRNVDTFVLENSKRSYGNGVVYGAIFLLNNFEFYIRQLDAYHACSLSALGRNHNLDLHHRVIRKVTQISFNTKEEFERLLYEEKEEFPCHVYVGNIQNPKITRRLNKVHSNRIIEGVHKQPFKQLIREVLQ